MKIKNNYNKEINKWNVIYNNMQASMKTYREFKRIYLLSLYLHNTSQKFTPEHKLELIGTLTVTPTKSMCNLEYLLNQENNMKYKY